MSPLSFVRAVLRRHPRLKHFLQRVLADVSLWRSGGLKAGGRPHDPKLPTVVVCTHEASLTGAPVLGWNLALELGKTHNVVSVLLRGGELADQFREVSCGYVCPTGPSIVSASPHAFARRILLPIRKRYGLDGVIANSIESELAVASAALIGVPRAALIHEFAEYTPKPRLQNVLASGATLVLSSVLLRESLMAVQGGNTSRVVVLPQGKCMIPATPLRPAAASVARILGRPSEKFVCVGCGYVQPRKGVDLFIAAAARVLDAGIDGEFVWIGDGYDPVRDFAVSVWLADQLKRTGHGDRIRIIPALSGDDFNEVFHQCDAMFLSSRLDPLPNVAIDALTAGVPVVCFDKTTGLAEYLREDDELRALVVPYFDISSAADVLVRLAADADLRRKVSLRSQQFGVSRFGMADYIHGILDALE